MIGPRWRSAASKDNDVKHEDHRYRIGLANGTKDIQLMIPYVTRRVFTRRLVTLLARPPPLTISRPLCFTSATPKWTAGYPLVRSIFFHSTREGRGARRRRFLVGRILPSPCVRDTPTASTVGVICGESVTFFYPLSRAIQPASTSADSQPVLPRRRPAKASPVPRSRRPLISFRLDRLAHLKMLILTPPGFSESVSVKTKR